MEIKPIQSIKFLSWTFMRTVINTVENYTHEMCANGNCAGCCQKNCNLYSSFGDRNIQQSSLWGAKVRTVQAQTNLTYALCSPDIVQNVMPIIKERKIGPQVARIVSPWNSPNQRYSAIFSL